MSDWARTRVSDVARVRHGFAFEGSFFSSDSLHPTLLTPGNFAIGGGFVDAKPKTFAGEVPEGYVLDPGDLVVTMTDLSRAGDTLGYSARVPRGGTYLHNQRIGLVEPIDGQDIDLGYLYYLFQTPQYRTHVIATASGSTVRHTSPSRIGDYVFLKPPKAEQQRIAGVLGALDDVVDTNRRLIAAQVSLVDAEFERRFGGRELEVPLGDLAAVVDCLHTKKPERTGDGTCVLLQLNNIRDDGLLDVTDRYLISDVDYARWSKNLETTAHDIVITNVGRVGAVARVPIGVVAALGRNMTAIRVHNVPNDALFVSSALLSSRVRREIERKTDAGTILNALNVRNIPKLRLPRSDPTERGEFSEWAQPFLEASDSLLAQSRELRSVRNELLPLLMSGMVRVGDVAGIAVEGNK